MDLYQQNILDHYKNPRKRGDVKNATHTGRAENKSCGDSLTVQLMIDDGGVIKQAGFTGEGCVLSQAAASMLLEKIVGQKINDLKKIDQKFIVDLLNISVGPNRLKCALMSMEAIKRAIGK